ncbi:MAG: Nitrogen regulatory protein [Rhodocyclaceae bacterium]|nr:Nitrogen regulatory protein [Rhodocyclaceae bacterium]
MVGKLLCPEQVLLDIGSVSKQAVIEDIGAMFEKSCGIERARVVACLLARERLGSTALGQGIAIPHGRMKGLREVRGGFVRLSEPVPFDAPDGKPVSLLFVLLVPEHANEQHLGLLSELAQMFADRDFRAMLATAPHSSAIVELFSQWQTHGKDQRRPAV